jgi:hypothetical protein
MRSLVLAIFAAAAFSTGASAATLTITPDRSTYAVGDTITLSVFGDSEGATDQAVYGRILFDGTLAAYVSSSQVPLTSFDGAVVWIAAPLDGGDGFAEAFDQLCCGGAVWPVDSPLVATVVLQATVPGRLDYGWQSEIIPPNDLHILDFFGLTDAPGGSVTIVPEPATGTLAAMGLLALVLWSAPHARSRSRLRTREDARGPSGGTPAT